jgi:hypothetical protein
MAGDAQVHAVADGGVLKPAARSTAAKKAATGVRAAGHHAPARKP